MYLSASQWSKISLNAARSANKQEKLISLVPTVCLSFWLGPWAIRHFNHKFLGPWIFSLHPSGKKNVDREKRWCNISFSILSLLSLISVFLATRVLILCILLRGTSLLIMTKSSFSHRVPLLFIACIRFPFFHRTIRLKARIKESFQLP